MSLRRIGNALKSAGAEFVADDALSLAAALSFYAALSLAPLVLLLVTIAGFLGEDSQAALIDQVEAQVGVQGAGVIEMIVENAGRQKTQGVWSAVIGSAVLLFGAAGVFAQLQVSLNRIWEIEVQASGKQGVWLWIRTRLLCFGMIGAIAFLLLVSLAVSAMLPWLLEGWGVGSKLIDFFVTFAVYVVLFALIYKVLPDAHIAWSDVWVGALVTALLFALGKFAISQYLAYSSVGSAYGVAGSLIVLLVWVYYSTLILFFGAEVTQAYAREFGSRIVPKSYATRTARAIS